MSFQLLIICNLVVLYGLFSSNNSSKIFQDIQVASATDIAAEDCKANTAIYEVSFSSDGNSILATWNNGTARLWDARTGDEIFTFGHETDYPTLSAKFSPDDLYVLVGERNAATLWDVKTGLQVHNYPRKVDNDPNGTVASFSNDGKYILSVGYDGTTLWETSTGKELQFYSDMTEGPYVAQLSNDNKYLLTTGAGIRIWDVQTGKAVKQFADAYEGLFSPDTKSLLVSDLQGLHIFEIGSWQEVANLGDYIDTWEISPDGNYIIGAENSNSLVLRETQAGTTMHTFDFKESNLFTVTFSVNSKQLLITGDVDTSQSYAIQVWNIERTNMVKHTVLADYGVLRMKMSPQNFSVLTGSDHGTVSLWDLNTGENLVRLC